MQASLEEVVKVRRELHCALKEVVCRWPNGNVMKEYLNVDGYVVRKFRDLDSVVS